MKNAELYEEITNRIIAEMEKGIIPWRRPWGGSGGAISHSTGKPYSVLNQLLMPAGEYITFNQCQKEGGKVKKGAKAHTVYFWKVYIKTENVVDNTGAVVEVKTKIPVMRYYRVFNINDCTGITPKYAAEATISANPIDDCEAVVNNYLAASRVLIDNHSGSDRAYYNPTMDIIVVPAIHQYADVEEYYSTLFHEMTHSTGHKSRLDRLSTGAAAAFGGEDYSKEELTAEIGAAMLVNYCGCETEKSFKNSAAYIQSWLAALRNDKTMIIGAASRADKAVKYILGDTAEELEAAEA